MKPPAAKECPMRDLFTPPRFLLVLVVLLVGGAGALADAGGHVGLAVASATAATIVALYAVVTLLNGKAP
jgi:hypothetical protein